MEQCRKTRMRLGVCKWMEMSMCINSCMHTYLHASLTRLSLRHHNFLSPDTFHLKAISKNKWPSLSFICQEWSWTFVKSGHWSWSFVRSSLGHLSRVVICQEWSWSFVKNGLGHFQEWSWSFVRSGLGHLSRMVLVCLLFLFCLLLPSVSVHVMLCPHLYFPSWVVFFYFILFFLQIQHTCLTA